MEHCLVSLSEQTIQMMLAARTHADETLDAVARRVLRSPPHTPRFPATRPALDVVNQVRVGGRGHSVTIFGATFVVATKQDVLATVVRTLADCEPSFLERLSWERGRTRRYVSRSREALYQGSPHLAKCARDIGSGWWLATNVSESDIVRVVRAACRLTDLEYGRDIVLHFAN